ncbi:MAG: phage tail assembly protein [Planktothrix sp. GU0601_MAG3]|nr:MAG: phage tail assembly protein [Planktothrix sp. GU0601_MAG3]
MENNSPITFSFSLPVGLLDNQDQRHQDGEMRLATGKDELYQTDARSWENPAYGTLILLSRVIVQLGELSPVTPEDLEGLFLKDWEYLQEIYNAINPPESAISTTGEL